QSPGIEGEVRRDERERGWRRGVPTSPERATVSRFYLLVGIRGVPCRGRSSLCRRHILNVVGGVLRVMRRTTLSKILCLLWVALSPESGRRTSADRSGIRLGSRPRLRSSPVPSRVRGDTFRHWGAAGTPRQRDRRAAPTLGHTRR